MASLKQQMMDVHRISEVIQTYAGVTESKEFTYTHGGKVPAGIRYHIHYTTTKKEVIMTGGTHNSNSKIIERVGDNTSTYSRYVRLKNPKRTPYPIRIYPSPKKSDYTSGRISRYFTQLANDIQSSVFEVSKTDYDTKNSLYRFFEVEWIISGKRTDAIRINLSTINSVSRIRGNEGFRKLVFPLQLWKPTKNTSDDIQSKLSRLKNVTTVEPFEYTPPPNTDWSLGNRSEMMYEEGDDTLRGSVLDPATGNIVSIRNLTNIVYGEDGLPIIGFINGSRVDIP